MEYEPYIPVVLDHVQDGILVLDPHGVVVEMNPAAARFLGCAQKDTLGKDFFSEDTRHNDLLDAFKELSSMPPQGVTKDGSTYEVCILPLPEDGAGTGRFFILRDLTALTRARTAKSEFFGAISHELRTPLNIIIGYSDMMLDERFEKASTNPREDLERINTAGKQLLETVNGLLAPSTGTTEETAKARLTALIREAPEDIERNNAPHRILVVDDLDENRDLLARRLQRDGHEVVVARDGLEALEVLHQENIDLVLLDIMMPRMDGFQVLKAVKDDVRLDRIPIVVISSLTEVDDIVRCIELGAVDYLMKPFNNVLLKARVNASLHKKRFRDIEDAYTRRIEEGKRRLDNLLRVILPASIAEELAITGHVEPRRFPDAVILFADVVGFSAYCRNRPPDAVVDHLQDLVYALEKVVDEHGLLKIKTIGDAFMASAGVLGEPGDHALQAVKCGLAMVDACASLASGWQLRVGIHTGPVIAGVVGHSRFLFDVWGDTVNIAARVESQGVPGEVNVTRAVWDKVCDDLPCKSQRVVVLRNVGEMEIIQVTHPPRN